MSHSAANGEQTVFLGRVGAWIEARLAEHDHFGSLVAALRGVDPVVVAATLRQLADRRDASGCAAASLLADAERVPATTAATRERPLPHPLEFYWAHSDESVDEIIGELAARTEPSAVIAYLAPPTSSGSARSVCATESMSFWTAASP